MLRLETDASLRMEKLCFQFAVIVILFRFVASEPSVICEDLVQAFGYPCIDHNVTTDDGYVLGLHQIPWAVNGDKASASENNKQFLRMEWRESKPAVLLQHGLMTGAESWLLNTKGQSLGLLLADEGFDVWLGNTRGSRWSHGHVTYTQREKQYWQWSWDELAEYDLPAMLAYVSNVTGQEKILYVGHSQGTAIALAGLTQPKVAAMIRGAALLCPVAYEGALSSRFLRTMADMRLDKILAASGHRNINLNSELGALLIGSVCSDPRVDCSHMLTEITGPNCCVDMSRAKEYLRWLPSSTSLQNMAHFSQMVRTGRWQKFDFNLRNILHYGSLLPPQYNPHLIPANLPLLFAYGGRDALSTPPDVEKLAGKLGAPPQMLLVPRYAHADFLLSVSVREDVYDDVIRFLWGSLNASVHSSL